MRVVGIVLSALAVMLFAAPVHAQGAETLQAPHAADTAEGVARESAETNPEPRATPVTAPAPAAPSQDANLGGAGESCRARSDCASGLRCFANVCRDPLEGTACGASSECGPNLRCYEQTCQTLMTVFSRAEAPSPGVERYESEERAPTVRHIRGFIGVSLMGGPTAHTHSGETMRSAFFAALRAGLYVGENEFALEIAPFSVGSTDWR